MDQHGYILKGNSKTAPTDYIPSLIGVDETQTNASRGDPYFERVDIADRRISSLSVSRWVSYDSLPLEYRDPILAVQSPHGAYYIPASELHEIAAFHHDDDTIEMLAALKVLPR
jgi:hypothetical protein